MNDDGRKGMINQVSNKKLEILLNMFGVKVTAKKLGVSGWGLYKNIKKRGGAKKIIFVFPKVD